MAEVVVGRRDTAFERDLAEWMKSLTFRASFERALLFESPKRAAFRSLVEDCVERLGYCPSPTELNQRMTGIGGGSYHSIAGPYTKIRTEVLVANGWTKGKSGRWER